MANLPLIREKMGRDAWFEADAEAAATIGLQGFDDYLEREVTNRTVDPDIEVENQDCRIRASLGQILRLDPQIQQCDQERGDTVAHAAGLIHRALLHAGATLDDVRSADVYRAYFLVSKKEGRRDLLFSLKQNCVCQSIEACRQLRKNERSERLTLSH